MTERVRKDGSICWSPHGFHSQRLHQSLCDHVCTGSWWGAPIEIDGWIETTAGCKHPVHSESKFVRRESKKLYDKNCLKSYTVETSKIEVWLFEFCEMERMSFFFLFGFFRTRLILQSISGLILLIRSWSIAKVLHESLKKQAMLIADWGWSWCTKKGVPVVTLILVVTCNRGRRELLVANTAHTQSMSHRLIYSFFCKLNSLNLKFQSIPMQFELWVVNTFIDLNLLDYSTLKCFAQICTLWFRIRS